MRPLFQSLIRTTSYPLIAGGAALLLVYLATVGAAYWPLFPLVVGVGITLVALLERVAPYERDWNRDHDGDTVADALHLFVSYVLIQGSVAIAFGLRAWVPDTWVLWPQSAPIWAQVLLAGLILDLGLYTMHRASHASGFLWKLHAIHHSPERLYWLNGGRRHPLSALVLAGPGLTVLFLLGATPIAVGAWLSFMSVHLAFQHANLGGLARVVPVQRLADLVLPTESDDLHLFCKKSRAILRILLAFKVFLNDVRKLDRAD